MSKDFSHLREWLVRERSNAEPGMVVLECVPSRSGMSMSVYDRGELLFNIKGTLELGECLARFLEEAFEPELSQNQNEIPARAFCGDSLYLDGGKGLPLMMQVAQALHLKVTRSESKAGTLLIIERGA